MGGAVFFHPHLFIFESRYSHNTPGPPHPHPDPGSPIPPGEPQGCCKGARLRAWRAVQTALPTHNANQSTPPVKALVQIPLIDAPVTYTDCLHTRHILQILRTTVSQSGSQPCHTQLQHCRIRQSRCPLPDRRYARRRRWLMSFSLVPVTERESCAHHVRPELHVEPELHGISLHSYFLVNTIPTGMGVDVNVKILDSFATHVAPALGWLPNREGPVTGYLID